jgi:hypothetical protein
MSRERAASFIYLVVGDRHGPGPMSFNSRALAPKGSFYFTPGHEINSGVASREARLLSM